MTQREGTTRRWRKRAKRVALSALVLLAALQVFHPRRTNPPEQDSHRIEALTRMPPSVARTIGRACRDCHSNTTHWPWYSAVAPVSWMVVGHVDEGRRHLNFSEWSRYDATESGKRLDDICRYVERGFMPLTSYTRIHRDASLTTEDVRTICEWTKTEASRLREQRTAMAEGVDAPGDRVSSIVSKIR